MDYAERQSPSAGMRRALFVLGVIGLVLLAGVVSFIYARRDTSSLRQQASQRAAEVSQLQAQLRSAAKQNDILSGEVRQGTRQLTSQGNDTQKIEKRLRTALHQAKRAQAKTKAKLTKATAKLKSLSSGLSASVGSINYIPPNKKGQGGSIQGSMTISNSTGLALDAVCVLDVGGVQYAIMSTGIPSKGNVVESFQFPYSGPKPSGASSGGCGRM